MSDTAFVSGSFLQVTDDGKGVYEITQVPYPSHLPKPVLGDGKERIEINYSFGFGSITGYFDPSTFEIGVEISIIGQTIGTFYGNLKEGLVIKVNLLVESGELKFSLKNGNEVWVNISLHGLKDFNKDVKLFSF